MKRLNAEESLKELAQITSRLSELIKRTEKTSEREALSRSLELLEKIQLKWLKEIYEERGFTF